MSGKISQKKGGGNNIGERVHPGVGKIEAEPPRESPRGLVAQKTSKVATKRSAQRGGRSESRGGVYYFEELD